MYIDIQTTKARPPFLSSHRSICTVWASFENGLWRNVVSQAHRHTMRPSLPTHNLDPQLIEKVVMSGPVMELKRYTGVRYQDAVIACLNREFDTFWQQPEENQKEQLQVYLVHIQNNIVNTIAHYNA